MAGAQRFTSDAWFTGAVLAVLLGISLLPRFSGELTTTAARDLVGATVLRELALRNAAVVVYSVSRAGRDAQAAARVFGHACSLVFHQQDAGWEWVAVLSETGRRTSADEYLRRVRAENEKGAADALRQLNTGEVAEYIRRGRYGPMTVLWDDQVLIVNLGLSEPRGYRLDLDVRDTSYRVIAVPLAYPQSGIASFYSDESLILRAADHHGGQATSADPEYNPDNTEDVAER